MSYKIVFTSSFEYSIKKLKKRYRHVKNDTHAAIQVLLQTPKLGAVIPGGFGVRKLRLRNSDLRKGKSGGYRLIYYVRDEPEQTIYLLLLYAKSDRPNITQRELKALLDDLSL